VLRQQIASIPNARWLPWIGFDEMPEAWNASYVTYFALRGHALYRGTIPAKLYEAMACGVPVLAALEGIGARFIAESGAGVTVPCGDAAGLIRALEEVLAQDSLRQRYSAAARRYAETHWDADRVAEAYEKTLIAAAATRRSASELLQNL
jgi:colanic acid biosynthesis glycosyl transferase WcaI